MLAGLSARSFGRFAYYVTQIAAGRVERGLPTALRRCGYRTFSIYPALGAFMSARAFQTTTGMQKFLDQGALGTTRIEPDEFYYKAALRMIERERDKGPMFLFVYLAGNHYPWDYRWRPDLMPEWRNPGNTPEVDEYLRRQSMSFRDYDSLLDRLKRDFPGEPFLVVRYGDHQPEFASFILEPELDEDGINRRLMTYDPRYFTTYYAIDTVNFRPSTSPPRSTRSRDRIFRSWCRRRPACRSMPPSPSRNAFSSAARAVLRLCRRRRGAALQPAADRRWPDQGALIRPAIHEDFVSRTSER